jgi:hypothetical protein
MADAYRQHQYDAKQFTADYFYTFARLLDPNLPQATASSTLETGKERWPLGQTVAFASIASVGLWAVLIGIVRYIA